ncbi:MAG: undecaprenyldiphospho-muramoylpentapeptide beta-N-acetylglucosaminyltransferase [Lactobacillales bacterium]|nr:undecaprenyldiphospho-muramoylpentapeptide beta-N-acetylglucosaminyltransferase [Lactobacillales bacterium]
MKKEHKNKQLIVVTTGGSGGHVFPAESISKALLASNFDVAFVTDKRGQNFQGLAGVSTYRLTAEHVTGRSLFRKIIAVFKLYIGTVQALFLLRKLKPALVLGVGGYASIPAVIAAHLWHIPVVLHEQNSILGRANRILAANSKLVATSFEPTLRIPKTTPSVWVGMPLRPSVFDYEKSPYPAFNDSFNIVIFGGSQGAKFFNEKLPDALFALPKEIKKKMVITQQVRAEYLEETEKKYETAGFKSYTLSPFFGNMPELISKAHLVFGRGGASTLSELMVIGRPGVIVPLPTSADNHQAENAHRFCDSGAGWLVLEGDFDASSFAVRLQEIITDHDLLKHAGEQAHKLAKPDASQKMASLISDIVKGS